MKEMSPKTKTHVSNGTLQMDFLLKLFLDHILCIYLMSAVTILVLTNVDTHAAHRYVNAQKEAVYILF